MNVKEKAAAVATARYKIFLVSQDQQLEPNESEDYSGMQIIGVKETV